MNCIATIHTHYQRVVALNEIIRLIVGIKRVKPMAVGWGRFRHRLARSQSEFGIQPLIARYLYI